MTQMGWEGIPLHWAGEGECPSAERFCFCWRYLKNAVVSGGTKFPAWYIDRKEVGEIYRRITYKRAEAHGGEFVLDAELNW